MSIGIYIELVDYYPFVNHFDDFSLLLHAQVVDHALLHKWNVIPGYSELFITLVVHNIVQCGRLPPSLAI